MTEEQHPITPPSELVQQWWDGTHGALYEFEAVVTQAARWGADQEFEWCYEAIKEAWDSADSLTLDEFLREFRSIRRPTPPSLKEQALEALDQADNGLTEYEWPSRHDIIRRALESLPS